MNNKLDTKQDTLTLYGAGGCGINLASRFHNFENSTGYAKINTVYCDASRSNIEAEIPEELTYVIPELDGSGKVRNENADVIKQHVGKVLEIHKPTKFNVVIFSASGGTGSVFGPLIATELVRRKATTVLIVVGDNESGVSVKNTLKTYKSLEAINRATSSPIVMSWHRNSADTPRHAVDKKIITTMAQLALLASGQNHELDTRDINNWIYYNNAVEGLTPQLSLLDITSDGALAQQIKNPISVVHLLRTADSPAKDLKPNYSCTGYLPEIKEGPDQGLVFVVSLGGIAELAQEILLDFETYEDLSKDRCVVNDTLLTDEDVVTEDGLVL